MTQVLHSTWHSPAPAAREAPSADRRRPILKVTPSQNDFAGNTATETPSTLATSIFSADTHLTPTSPSSPKSPSSFTSRMHFRMRSITSKPQVTPARKYEKLSDKEKAASQKFVKDAVAMCGLAGFNWRKTHEYLHLAADLPLHPDYHLYPHEPILSDDMSSNGPSPASSRRPSTSHLMPDAASTTPSRPSTSTPSTMSVSSSSSSIHADLKPILTSIRILFEGMQKQRDPIYMRYLELPNNNLKKMRAHAVAKHRAATLRQERSSIMDAITFDKNAAKAEGMETAVAKLRFEMELEIAESIPDEPQVVSESLRKDVAAVTAKTRAQTGSGASIKHSLSTISFPSFGQRSLASRSSRNHPKTDPVEMSRGASNDSSSGVPTIVATFSDAIDDKPRQVSAASSMISLDRPHSLASSKSDGHVQNRETWKRLQEARRRLSRSSRSRGDGVSRPSVAQKIDEQGFFAARPAAATQ